MNPSTNKVVAEKIISTGTTQTAHKLNGHAVTVPTKDKTVPKATKAATTRCFRFTPSIFRRFIEFMNQENQPVPQVSQSLSKTLFFQLAGAGVDSNIYARVLMGAVAEFVEDEYRGWTCPEARLRAKIDAARLLFEKERDEFRKSVINIKKS